MLRAIVENPYRTLGLTPTASERELAKRVSDLGVSAEMGKSRQYETDCPDLIPIARSTEAISAAADALENPENRFFYATTWFWPRTPVDELAFDAVKAGQASKAASLWMKSFDTEQGGKHTSGSANLSVLQLARASAGLFDPVLWEQGIRAAGRAFSSPQIGDHLRPVVAEAARLNLLALGRRFVDEVYCGYEPLIGASEGISPSKFLSAFDTFPPELTQHAVERVFGARVHRIESALVAAARARESDPENGCHAGSHLLDECEDSLLALRAGLGAGHLQYGLLADKVANEALQCSIDFFNDDKSGDSSVPMLANRVAERCSELAVGGRVQNRIADTIRLYKEYEREAAARAPVQPQIDAVHKILAQLPSPPVKRKSVREGLPAQASAAYKEILPHLNVIYGKVGRNSELAIGFSSFVTRVLMSVTITVVNSGGSPASVSALVKELASLPMDEDTADHYQRNAATLRQLEAEAAMALSAALRSSQQKSSGCFVATAVYGSVTAPEVARLRQYRDSVLSRTTRGRLFIRAYYSVSPALAAYVVRRPSLRRLMKPMLDAVVTRLP